LLQLAAQRDVAAPELRRAFAAAVSARTGVGGAAMADSRALVRLLRRVGVTTDTARSAQLVLAEIDRATYGGETRASATELARRAAETYRSIDAEAIPRAAGRRSRALRGAGLTLVTLVAIGATSVMMADEARDAARFADGVAHYDRGDFEASMTAFREVASRVPRAADAWANLGTAAWHAGDSASAAVGWQRALRLEPLASDVRGRLETTPGFRAGLLGDVPPVPIDAAAALGMLLWLGGWGGLALALAQGRTERLAPAGWTVAGGALVGVLTLALAERLSGRDHVVVVEGGLLRSAPVLGAEPGAGVIAGEGGVETVAQGVWSRVRFADGRAGWIETRRLASLDLTRAP
jgi:tetratricopeptide (TPR) repeat protein